MTHRGTGSVQSLDGHQPWQAVIDRNRHYDGLFVYAVTSTMIYCRPSCPSRRPDRSRIQFFDSPRAAEMAGFRPCRRCRPQSDELMVTDQRIDRARRYLDEHSDEPITLQRLASEVGLSPFHLHRAFRRQVGCSPKQYRDVRRMERFTSLLKQGRSVSMATYEAGFGSSSRLYERVNRELGMTPSALKAGGRGARITYTTTSTPIGPLLLAATQRGLVAVRFGRSADTLIHGLKRDYPKATLLPDANGLKAYVEAILDTLAGNRKAVRLPLDLAGTAFQRRVWQALQDIPPGSTRSYRELAASIGKPAAARAVARACATNPVAFVIPCHRVVRGDGGLGGYRWGLDRKKQLLALEQEQIKKRRS